MSNFMEASVEFHGTEYNLSINYSIDHEHQDDYLYLKLFPKNNKQRIYHSKFSPQYIEEMTRKTGNFKSFAIFVEMLISSMDKTSNSVFLDLLSNQDLEEMKKQSNAFINYNRRTQDITSNKKIYLILTYAIAFDRIHYPLPLSLGNSSIKNENFNFQQQNRVNNFKINDNSSELLNSQIMELQSDRQKLMKEQIKIKKENDRLKHELKQLIILSKENNQNLLEPKKNFRLTSKKVLGRSHKSNQPNQSSKYRVVKSEPLLSKNIVKNESKPRRNNAAVLISSKANSKTSRSRNNSLDSQRVASRSPFRRFEPTEYILERNRKIEEKKRNSRNSISNNNSRSSSVSSMGSRTSLNSAYSLYSGKSASNQIQKKKSNDNFNYNNSIKRSSSNSSVTKKKKKEINDFQNRGSRINDHPTHIDVNSRSLSRNLSISSIQNDDFDKRLDLLQQFLAQSQL
ncbi:Coiled-coil domain-containing protein 61 [Lobulomyces angularis]|nr:Coiled-coil domain-containing protein 61 [Lobulomyces angularis]